jgi:hypothetical protein
MSNSKHKKSPENFSSISQLLSSSALETNLHFEAILPMPGPKNGKFDDETWDDCETIISKG